jgi:hypothetical protein
MASKRELKDEIKKGKQPINCSGKELRYAMTSFGKADYQKGLTQSKETVLRPGRKICQICNKEYDSKSSGKHKRTKYHQIYEQFNKKMRDFVLNQ